MAYRAPVDSEHQPERADFMQFTTPWKSGVPGTLRYLEAAGMVPAALNLYVG